MRNEKEIGEIIRQLRGNLSLRDFAQKCDISHTTIDNLEKGIDYRTGKPTQVKIVTLQKIADACKVPLAYLTGEESFGSDDEKLMLALFGNVDILTKGSLNKIREYARYIYEEEHIGKNTAKRLRSIIRDNRISLIKLSKVTHIPKDVLISYLDLKTIVPVEELKILAIALNVSVDYLRGNTKNKGIAPSPSTRFEDSVASNATGLINSDLSSEKNKS